MVYSILVEITRHEQCVIASRLYVATDPDDVATMVMRDLNARGSKNKQTTMASRMFSAITGKLCAPEEINISIVKIKKIDAMFPSCGGE
jgi:hypothetical protein